MYLLFIHLESSQQRIIFVTENECPYDDEPTHPTHCVTLDFTLDERYEQRNDDDRVPTFS